jgi:hypothetical protein
LHPFFSDPWKAHELFRRVLLPLRRDDGERARKWLDPERTVGEERNPPERRLLELTGCRFPHPILPG